MAKLPDRCGAPQSAVVREPDTSVSGVRVLTVHGIITSVVTTVSGLPAIAPALITTCPACVPVARPAGFNETIVESLGGADPDVLEKPIQVLSFVAVQLSDPPPELLT